MATGVESNTKDTLHCSICLELFTRPKLLPCHHTFCALCLQDYIEKSRRGSTFDCPVCRKSTLVPRNGVEEYQTNFYIADKKDTDVQLKDTLCEVCGPGVNATHHCTDCEENLCSDCTRCHMKMKISQHHKMLELATAGPDTRRKIKSRVFCTEHTREEVKIYCQQCDKFLCLICSVTDHAGHTSKDVGKEARELRQRLTTTLENGKINEGITILEINIACLENTNAQLQKCLQDDIKSINDQEQAAVTAIKTAVEGQKNELGKIYDVAIQENCTSIASYRTQIESFKKLSQSTRTCIDFDNDVEIVKERDRLLKQMMMMEKRIPVLNKVANIQYTRSFGAAHIQEDDVKKIIGTVNKLKATSKQTSSVAGKSTKLKLEKTFKKFNDHIYGIAPFDHDKAWCSIMGEKKVNLVSKGGEVLKTIDIQSKCDDVAVDNEGNCFVSCPNDKTIKLVLTNGTVKTLISECQDYPHGVAYRRTNTGNEEIWFTCCDSHAQYGKRGSIFRTQYNSKFQTTGKVTLVCSGEGNMSRIAADQFIDNICVSSRSNTETTVQVFGSDGQQIGAYCGSPSLGVAFEDDGYVIVASEDSSEILKLSTTGSLQQVLLSGISHRSVGVDGDLLWVGMFSGEIRIYRIE